MLLFFSSNLCVGFDTQPAQVQFCFLSLFGLAFSVASSLLQFVALPFMVLTAYLSMRYAWTDSQRTLLQSQSTDPTLRITTKQANFLYFANGYYAVSCMLIPMLLILTPFTSRPFLFGHLYLFVNIIISVLVVVHANFYSAKVVTRNQKIYLYYLTLVSVCLPTFYTASFLVYFHKLDNGLDHSTPLIPMPIVLWMDLSWFLCMPLVSKYLPDCPKIFAKFDLVAHRYHRHHNHHHEEKQHEMALISCGSSSSSASSAEIAATIGASSTTTILVTPVVSHPEPSVASSSTSHTNADVAIHVS